MDYRQHATKTILANQEHFIDIVKGNCSRLAKMIGPDAYNEFADAFPDDITWSEINKRVKAKIAEVAR